MQLECFLLVWLHDKSAIFFTMRKMRMCMNLDHVPNGHAFVLGRDVLCEFDYCPGRNDIIVKFNLQNLIPASFHITLQP